MAVFAIDDILVTGLYVSGQVYDIGGNLGAAGQPLVASSSGLVYGPIPSAGGGGSSNVNATGVSSGVFSGSFIFQQDLTISGNLKVTGNATINGLTANQYVKTNANQTLITVANIAGPDITGAGSIFFGSGANNSISIKLPTGYNPASGNFNAIFDTVQDIRTSASPTFNNITFSALTASQYVKTNSSKQLTTVANLAGQDITGAGSIFFGSGANNSIYIVNPTGYNPASGNFNAIFDTVQDIRQTASPTFNNITFSATTANQYVKTNASKQLITVANIAGQDITGAGSIFFGSGANNSIYIITPTGYNPASGNFNCIIDTAQDIRRAALPTFSGLILTSLVANQYVKVSGNNYLISSKNLNGGDITGIILDGAMPGAVMLTGNQTVNDVKTFTSQVILNNGTLNTPGLVFAGDTSIGLYFLNNSLINTGIAFVTNATRRMLITNTGSIGIGNDIPVFQIDISGTGRFSGPCKGANGTNPDEFVTKSQLDATGALIGGGGSTFTSTGSGLAVFSGTQGSAVRFRSITGVNNLNAVISGDNQTIIFDTNPAVTFATSVTTSALTVSSTAGITTANITSTLDSFATTTLRGTVTSRTLMFGRTGIFSGILSGTDMYAGKLTLDTGIIFNSNVIGQGETYSIYGRSSLSTNGINIVISGGLSDTITPPDVTGGNIILVGGEARTNTTGPGGSIIINPGSGTNNKFGFVLIGTNTSNNPKVGIGTTSPSGSLDVYGSGYYLSGRLLVAPTCSTVVGGDLIWFGDGSDGNVVIGQTGLFSGNWINTGKLLRDVYFNNLTFNNSGKIFTDGYKIFVKGILDITQATGFAINYSGNSGTLSAGGVGFASKSVGGSVGGSAPGAGTSTAGNAATAPFLMWNVNGGPGGSGGNGGAGASAAGPSAVTGFVFSRPIRYAKTELIWGQNIISGGGGGVGGGGGGGAGAFLGNGANGGGGGAGGGVIFISAKTINRTNILPANQPIISARGGDGGPGSSPVSGARGGGGGGAGGGGGWVYLIYQNLLGVSGFGIIDVNGGWGGTGGNSGGVSPAARGTSGEGGWGGRITIVDLKNETIQDIDGTKTRNQNIITGAFVSGGF